MAEVIFSSSWETQKLIGAVRKIFELVFLFSVIFKFVQTVNKRGDVILQCTMHKMKKRNEYVIDVAKIMISLESFHD